MSPASGDTVSTFSDANYVITAVSIQLMSPASGDEEVSFPDNYFDLVFPFN